MKTNLFPEGEPGCPSSRYRYPRLRLSHAVPHTANNDRPWVRKPRVRTSYADTSDRDGLFPRPALLLPAMASAGERTNASRRPAPFPFRSAGGFWRSRLQIEKLGSGMAESARSTRSSSTPVHSRRAPFLKFHKPEVISNDSDIRTHI